MKARLSLGLGLVVVLACASPEEPPHLLYEQDVASLDNPFPDLRFLGDDGFRFREDWFRPFMMKDALTPRMIEMLNAWAQNVHGLQGVGNLGTTLLRTSHPVDVESFRGAVHRLRKVGNGYEVLERGVVVESSRAPFANTGKPYPADYPDFLLIRPSVTLPELEEGLLVVVSGPKTASGAALGRGRGFDADASVQPFFGPAAAALGVSEKDVLFALPLRAQPARSVFRSVADWANTQIPAYEIPAVKAVVDGYPVGVWTSADSDWATILSWLNIRSWANPATLVGKVVVGTYRPRDLRDADGVWTPALVAQPSTAPAAPVKFVLTLPAGPKPAGGYRIVIGAHGLNARNSLRMGLANSFCAEVAQVLAKANLGCLGIDAVNHGSRGASFDFFELSSLSKTRENFRQSMFDLVQLARLARSLDVDGDGGPDLSPELGYLGSSLGAILGGGALSYMPDVRYAVLNAGGGEMANILVSEDIEGKIGLLTVAKTGILFRSPEYFAAFPLFRSVGQLILEGTDPVNLAEPQTDRAVLLQMNLGDRTIPNFVSEHLARAMRLPEITEARQGSNPIQGMVVVDPARYLAADKLSTYNPHNMFWDVAPSRDQAIRFLEQRGTQLVAE